MPLNSTHYAVLYPQNGDRVLAVDFVTSLDPMYTSYHDNETHDLDVQCRPSRDRDPYTRRNKVKGQTVQKIEWKKTDGHDRSHYTFPLTHSINTDTILSFLQQASLCASPLRELTCHTASHSVTCHPAAAGSQQSWYSISDPGRMQG